MVAIKGFVKNSLIEWEGKIVAIIFLSHCNLRCQFCHSPHLVNNPNELETIPEKYILESVSKNKEWLDGVVISGGEPTMWKDLGPFLELFHDLGMKIKLDTNGTYPDVIEKLFNNGLIDYFAMDIKAPLIKEKYDTVTGVDCDIKKIRQSVNFIMNCGAEYEFRTTICPAFLDKDDIEDIAQTIKGADKYILQNFRPFICLNNKLLDITPYSLDTLEEFAEMANKHVKSCWVRGNHKEIVSREW